MRELIFKNLTSSNRTKRDIFVQETVTKDGIIASSERRCLYFIKDKVEITNPADLAKVEKIKNESQGTKRDFHILKEHDTKTGTDKLICKLKGTFYAVIGKFIYCIVFIHSFKIRFKALTTEIK